MSPSVTLTALASVLALAASLASGLSAGTEPTAAAREKCCFRNPGYAGGCIVEPAPEETCASILEYLNDPGAVGKNYCSLTDVREGWVEVACPDG